MSSERIGVRPATSSSSASTTCSVRSASRPVQHEGMLQARELLGIQVWSDDKALPEQLCDVEDVLGLPPPTRRYALPGVRTHPITADPPLIPTEVRASDGDDVLGV